MTKLTRRGHVRLLERTSINYLRRCAYYREVTGGFLNEGERPVCSFGCTDEPSCYTSEPCGGYRVEPVLLPRARRR